MTKQEILKELAENGLMNKYDQSSTWKKAFDLYNNHHSEKLHPGGCSMCYRTVLKWLQG